MTFRRTHHAVAHHLPQRDYRRPSDGKQTYVDRQIQPGHANKSITINIFIRHFSQTKTQKHAAGYICKLPPSYCTRWADNMIPTVRARSFLKKKKEKKSPIYHQADGGEQIVRPAVCLSCFCLCLLFQPAGSKSDSETWKQGERGLNIWISWCSVWQWGVGLLLSIFGHAEGKNSTEVLPAQLRNSPLSQNSGCRAEREQQLNKLNTGGSLININKYKKYILQVPSPIRWRKDQVLLLLFEKLWSKIILWDIT